MLFKIIIGFLNRYFKDGLDSDEDRRSMSLLASWLNDNLQREKAGLRFFSYQEYLVYVFGGRK